MYVYGFGFVTPGLTAEEQAKVEQEVSKNFAKVLIGEGWDKWLPPPTVPPTVPPPATPPPPATSPAASDCTVVAAACADVVKGGLCSQAETMCPGACSSACGGGGGAAVIGGLGLLALLFLR